MKRLLLVSSLLGLVGFIVAIYFQIRFATVNLDDIVNKADSFVNLIRKNESSNAYLHLSGPFRSSINQNDFDKYIAEKKIANIERTEWEAPKLLSDNMAILKGVFTFNNEDSTPIKFTFLLEENIWNIYSIRDNFSEPFEEILVDKTKLYFREFILAIDSKSFEKFYDNISTMWKKQTNPRDLTVAFEGLFKFSETLQTINDIEPVIFSAFATEDDILEINGHFRTYPSTVYFRLKYVYEGFNWKPLGFSTHIVCHDSCPSLKQQPSIPKDIVILVDNSNGMKEVDPSGLIKKALQSFILKLNEDINLSLIIYDKDVKKPPFKVFINRNDEENIQTLLGYLNRNLDYAGEATHTADGIETAIAFFRSNSSDIAEKIIILLTDNFHAVSRNTGVTTRERERELKEEILQDIIDEKIKITVVAVSLKMSDSRRGMEEAIKTARYLAQQSGGEYVWAVETADLPTKLGILQHIVTKSSQDNESSLIKPGQSDRDRHAWLSLKPAESWLRIPSTFDSKDVSGKYHFESKETDRFFITLIIALGIVTTFSMIAYFWLRLRERGKSMLDQLAVPENQNVQLVATGENLENTAYDITRKIIKIGRSSDNDIILDYDGISSHHARVECRNNVYWISDQGSITGTFVNDKEITEEKPLKIGNRIRFYTYDFIFELA